MFSNNVSDRETVLALFDEYEAVCEKMAALTFGALSLPELLDVQSRLERETCRTPVIDHALITEMQTRTTPQAIGAKSWADVLAMRMRISLSAAKHRIVDAAALAPRTTLTGEPLPPQLPATAAAQADGRVNAEHRAVPTFRCTSRAVSGSPPWGRAYSGFVAACSATIPPVRLRQRIFDQPAVPMRRANSA